MLNARVSQLSLIVVATMLTGTTLAACLGPSHIVDTQNRELAIEELDLLEFEVGSGELDVIGEEGLGSIVMDVDLRTHRDILDADGAARTQWRVELTREDDRILARVDLEDVPFGYFAHTRIRVPSRMRVIGRDGSGRASLSDLASLEIEKGSGELDVQRIGGAVTIEDGSGTLTVDDVQGQLSVIDASGEIFISHVSGSCRILDGSGGVFVDNVGEDLEIEDGSGSIEVRAIGGTVTITDGSGDIIADNVGELNIVSGGSGDVILDGVQN